eukprot:scaffold13279_cov114-Isochrysis_galbana.AAC.1
MALTWLFQSRRPIPSDAPPLLGEFEYVGPGAEGRIHYLGGGSLYGCPPELSFEQRMRREHEFKGAHQRI